MGDEDACVPLPSHSGDDMAPDEPRPPPPPAAALPFDDLLRRLTADRLSDPVKERLLVELVRAQTVLHLAGTTGDASAMVQAWWLQCCGGGPSPALGGAAPAPAPTVTGGTTAGKRTHPEQHGGAAPAARAPKVARQYGDRNQEWAIELHQPSHDPEGRERRRLERGARLVTDEDSGPAAEGPRALAAGAGSEDGGGGGGGAAPAVPAIGTADPAADPAPQPAARAPFVIDWSEEIALALEDAHGLVSVWMSHVVPHLGLPVVAESGLIGRPRPGKEARHVARLRLEQLVLQYEQAHDHDGVPVRDLDAQLMAAIRNRGVEGVLTEVARIVQRHRARLGSTPPPAE